MLCCLACLRLSTVTPRDSQAKRQAEEKKQQSTSKCGRPAKRIIATKKIKNGVKQRKRPTLKIRRRKTRKGKGHYDRPRIRKQQSTRKCGRRTGSSPQRKQHKEAQERAMTKMNSVISSRLVVVASADAATTS